MSVDTQNFIVTIVVALIAAAPGIVALISQRRKQGAETRSIEADIIIKYQDKYDSAMDRIKILEEQRIADNDAGNIKFKALRAEIEKQTALAEEHRRKAETVAAENVHLIRRISGLEATLKRILEWAHKWEPKLIEAGIEPMPTGD